MTDFKKNSAHLCLDSPVLSVKEALGYFGPKMFGMKKYPSDELIDGFKEGGTGFTPFGGFQFAYQ